MTRFEVKVDCTATISDDRRETHKGGHCHKVVSGECARDKVRHLITQVAEVTGSHWRGYNEGPIYGCGGTCYLRNGDLNGLTEEHPTRERPCGHQARGTVIVDKPGGTVVKRLNQMGFRQR